MLFAAGHNAADDVRLGLYGFSCAGEREFGMNFLLLLLLCLLLFTWHFDAVR